MYVLAALWYCTATRLHVDHIASTLHNTVQPVLSPAMLFFSFQQPLQEVAALQLEKNVGTPAESRNKLELAA